MLSNRLLEFIAYQRGEKKSDLKPDTRLYEDLGVYGDDAAELLYTYSREFQVDLKSFDIDKY
ncbi:DUF1493 family protein, partial [Fulvivirga sp. RKSG066]|uniref:DUF1493 family protein n=1 Tax=Fulvivirga aurantia TaxID=2529383 RepID=UPI0012BC1CEC|nr:DUF1493 family protein [Fulvivirga aurantia]